MTRPDSTVGEIAAVRVPPERGRNGNLALTQKEIEPLVFPW